MIRIIAKAFAVAVILAAFFPVAPMFAAAATLVTYVSSTGNDANQGGGCTAALPCGTLFGAGEALNGSNGQISCLNAPGAAGGFTLNYAGPGFTIDCPGTFAPAGTAFILAGSNQVMKIRNLTVSGTGGATTAIQVTGGGTLILENCVFENLSNLALDIEPTGPFNLVIKNSRISNNVGGVLIKPAAGGSVTATFDGVTLVNNGGGLKTDTTNGAVRVDVSNSTFSDNTANGMNIIGGAGGNNIVNLSHDVLAANGQVGIVANGPTSGVFLDTTSLDGNANGATSVVNGGHIVTYGNNRIIGMAGSGYTATAPLN